MNEHYISRRLRHAVKTSAPIDDVNVLVDEALTNQDESPARLLESALNRAVHDRNTAALRVILTKCRDFEPTILDSVLSWSDLSGHQGLLYLAIQNGNVDALKTLLEFGANPNGDGVHFDFLESTLCVAAISPQPLLYEPPLSTIELADDSPQHRSISYEIIQQLLAFGADPLLHAMNGSGTIPLHYASHLAGLCPDAANLLVRSTPPLGYDCRYDRNPGTGIIGNHLLPTPLSKALCDACHIARLRGNTTSLFCGVILPLLRAGASLTDPFLGCPSFSLEDLMFLDNHISLVLWQRHYMVVWLVLEARWTSGLSTTSNALLSQMSTKSTEHAAFTNVIRSLYPRRLDLLCRTAILRHLPRGIEARPEAIDSLGLPLMLSDFLNMVEFNVV